MLRFVGVQPVVYFVEFWCGYFDYLSVVGHEAVDFDFNVGSLGVYGGAEAFGNECGEACYE